MKTVLHIGAHRTGSTTFQSYVRRHIGDMNAVGFWGPRRTRKGLFAGISAHGKVAYQPKVTRHAKGRIRLQLDRSAAQGLHTLLISDENMIGTVRENLRARSLYPAIGERMARFDAAFDGGIDRVVLTIRSLDHWWRSAAAFGITRGAAPLSPEACDLIAAGQRGWRDVIADLTCALPRAEVLVLPFESHDGRPDAVFHAAVGQPGPIDRQPEWLNKSPRAEELREILQDRGDDPSAISTEGARWSPFDPKQHAALRELYEDDLFWLRAGAEGLATLIEDPRRHPLTIGGVNLTGLERGHVGQTGRMASPG